MTTPTDIAAPEPFLIVRHHDVTGVSGTGVVAEGVQFSDGTVALQRGMRITIAAALRVMADDIRALHAEQECVIAHEPGARCWGRWCEQCQHPWPCPTVVLLDAYVGESS